MPTADVNGIRLNYSETGSGDAVVLITGFGGDIGFWKKGAQLLSQGFRVIAVDNRGAGLTQCGEDFSLQDMADDVACLLDHLGIFKVHILGWSMGSHVAARFAARYPDRTRSLVLVSAYMERPSRSRYILDESAKAAERYRDPHILAVAINSFCLTEDSFRRMQDDGREVRDPTLSDAKRMLAQLKAVDGSVLTDVLPKIKAPTLSIHGEKDIMVELSEGDRVADMIPGCERIRLPGMGHQIVQDAYMGRVRRFFEDH